MTNARIAWPVMMFGGAVLRYAIRPSTPDRRVDESLPKSYRLMRDFFAETL